jgi:hypothetical protein
LFLNNPGHGKITLLVSASMVLIFLGLGCMFLFTDAWIENIPPPNRSYIGYVLIGWAVFRGLTVVMKYRRISRDEEDENQ